IQSFDPLEVHISAGDLEVRGSAASANIEMEISYPGEGDSDPPRTLTAESGVRLAQQAGVWRLDGPDLAPYEVGPDELDAEGRPEFRALLALEHPPGRDADWLALSRGAGERLAEIAGLLGLDAPEDAALLLFSDFESLRDSTTLTLEEDQMHWVQPGQLRIVYTEELVGSPALDAGLTHLLLAEAGVARDAAPWLWDGLPLAVHAEVDPIGIQKQLVPNLADDLADPNRALTPSAAWAAVDFALDQSGWPGLGVLVGEIGELCRAGDCDQIDGPMQTALGYSAGAFDSAWRNQWQSRLEAAQEDLDRLTAAREAAVFSEDRAGFLSTVDPTRATLLAEEQAWFEALSERQVHEYALDARALAWLEDGRLLAAVDTAYLLDSAEPGEERVIEGLEIVFEAGEDRLLWSGPLLEQIEGDLLEIRYPAGQEALATALLAAGENYFAALEDALGFSPEEKLEATLFEDPAHFHSSIALTMAGASWLGGWTENGQSIKLRLNPSEPQDEAGSAYLPEFLDQMTRYFLLDSGVREEWLLKGLSAILIGHNDGGRTQGRIAAGLAGLQDPAEESPLVGLDDFRRDHQLSEEGAWQARIQAWDSLRFFIEQYGWDSLLSLVGAHARGAGLDSAAQRSVGVSLDSFEQAWRESLARNHLDDTWQDAAASFDQEQAMAHLAILTSPEMAGRLSGTPGDLEAQRYIADRFRAYGLEPAGDRSGFGSPGFFQRFPVTTTVLVEAPRFLVENPQGESLGHFVYRSDFNPILAGPDGGDSVSGDIVWVDDEDFALLALNGEIIMRRQSGTLEEEVSRAAEHGAGGLIFVGVGSIEEDLAKRLGADAGLPRGDIPVFELTESGSKMILEAVEATLLTPPKTEPGDLLGLAATMRYTAPEARQIETANVLGLLPGSDPYLAQELIVLGAHYDHVGDDPSVEDCSGGDCLTVPGLRYSGINDNASGVAVLLEIARLWQEQGYRPKRSVLFAAWGANEISEAGSRYFVENPTVPLDNALGSIQLDGVGGGEGFFLSAQGVEGEDGRLMTSLANAGEIFEEKVLLFEGSVPGDQLPFKEAGYPGLLVQWRLANEDNLPDEFANRVDPGRLGSTGRLVTLALMGLAGGG
ncbi:MAG: M20/M25/M40 family metallo-hydrolase, partial [Anaerolineales bacterium]|nr:M20/M25/M40 family metallo-hydrolase [Anaerolineales bacterium]